MLSALSRTLARHGYHVLSASGPRQALEIFESNISIQLILSDIHMPGMRGTQLVREVLRLSPRTAGILMTGDGTPTDVPEGVALIKKPFCTQELISEVQLALAQSAEQANGQLWEFPPKIDRNWHSVSGLFS
jgi:DNA-binding NtrC family response regulator